MAENSVAIAYVKPFRIADFAARVDVQESARSVSVRVKDADVATEANQTSAQFKCGANGPAINVRGPKRWHDVEDVHVV